MNANSDRATITAESRLSLLEQVEMMHDIAPNDLHRYGVARRVRAAAI